MYESDRARALRCLANELLPQQRVPSRNIDRDFDPLYHLLDYPFPSVAADEALCISTIFQLPLEELLQVPDNVQDGVSKIWARLAREYGGIPQRILCCGSPRLDVKG